MLYAFTPTIVISNRLSLTENLLTPLSLLTLWFFSQNQQGIWSKIKPWVVGLTCGLALISKNIAITLPAVLIWLLFEKKQWRNLLIIAAFSLFFALIHPLIGLYYNWDLYLAVLADYGKAHSLGLPKLVTTLFRFPVIGHKEAIFLDGSILAGYILFFQFAVLAKRQIRRYES